MMSPSPRTFVFFSSETVFIKSIFTRTFVLQTVISKESQKVDSGIHLLTKPPNLLVVGNFYFSIFSRLTWKFLGLENERGDSVCWLNNKITRLMAPRICAASIENYG